MRIYDISVTASLYYGIDPHLDIVYTVQAGTFKAATTKANRLINKHHKDHYKVRITSIEERGELDA